MVWARRLRPASFRGVPFKVKSHTYGTGRKVVEHDIPGNDSQYSEDMGRKTRSFQINGYIIDDDVFRLRDNLIDACEKEGAGELVHPYLGTKNVQCVDFSFTEDTTEGRIVLFTITFKEAGSAKFPSSIFDDVASFFDAANNAVDQVNAAFEAAYTIAGFPGYVLTEAVAVVDRALDTVNDAITKVRLIPDQADAVKAKIEELKLKTDELARDSELLYTEITNLFKDVKDAVADPEENTAIDTTSGKDDKVTVLEDLITFGDDRNVIEGTTETRQQQVDNEKAINDLVKGQAIIVTVEASVIKEYTTLSDAENQKEKLLDYIDGVLDSTDDDGVFQSFSDIRASMLKIIPNENQITSEEVSVSLKQTTSSLVLIYEKTGNIENESDLIKRNNIREPGFIEPGDYTVING